MRRTILIILVIGIAAGLAWFFTRVPQQDLAWLPEQSRLTVVDEAADGALDFRNVRDWTYSDTEVLGREWIDLRVAPAEITRTWFFIDHFSGIHGIAHPFLSFEFADGRTLAVSVEARREEHEAYSPLKGAFRQYELSYIWSTERDMVVRRLVNADHPVLMYPLELSPEESASLLALLAEDTNRLAAEPRFYNTITGNCMNLLARIINTLEPGRLPYGIAWNLPGYADTYLNEQDLIAEGAFAAADLVPHRDTVRALATTPPEAFSAGLRALLVAR